MQPSASFQRRQIQAEHAKRVIERAEEYVLHCLHVHCISPAALPCALGTLLCRDMIDITQSALDMEQEDPSEAAAQLYISNMRSTRVDARQVKDTPPSWFPAASAPGKGPLATHATEASSARARKVATRVATAVLGAQVPQKKVQKITATFTSPA